MTTLTKQQNTNNKQLKQKTKINNYLGMQMDDDDLDVMFDAVW